MPRFLLNVDFPLSQVILTSTYLIFPDALFAEVAVPSLALVRVVLAVVALLALVAPIVAVNVTVADLLLVDVVRALAVVLVRVVLAVRSLAVATLRLRYALSGRGALKLVVPALLVGVDLGAEKCSGSVDMTVLTMLNRKLSLKVQEKDHVTSSMISYLIASWGREGRVPRSIP